MLDDDRKSIIMHGYLTPLKQFVINVFKGTNKSKNKIEQWILNIFILKKPASAWWRTIELYLYLEILLSIVMS